MNGAVEYLASIKARIVAHPRVVRWTVVREEAQGDQGLLRYRLMLHGGDLCDPLSGTVANIVHLGVTRRGAIVTALERQGAGMEYAVLVERQKTGWRAFIPALSDLDAEGASRDQAVQNVQRAAEAYLSSVEITTIEVKLPQEPSWRRGSPRTLLRALEAFAGDEEALRKHFEDIARERQRQRAEAQQTDVE